MIGAKKCFLNLVHFMIFHKFLSLLSDTFHQTGSYPPRFLSYNALVFLRWGAEMKFLREPAFLKVTYIYNTYTYIYIHIHIYMIYIYIICIYILYLIYIYI